MGSARDGRRARAAASKNPEPTTVLDDPEGDGMRRRRQNQGSQGYDATQVAHKHEIPREEYDMISNGLNCLLMLAVALPAVWATKYVFEECDPTKYDPVSWTWAPGHVLPEVPDVALDADLLCRVGLFHPLLYVNVIFLLNVCVLFWLVSLLQGSTWLIDPYWTIIPPMIGVYYRLHPLGHADDQVLLRPYPWSWCAGTS